jgi:single-stranded-DNA-specific exonuclease
MEKRWVLKERADDLDVTGLSKALNINKRLAGLLIQRNIKTYDEAKKFFRPNLKDLYDPLLMKDMDKAVERVRQAIETGEKIMIYGDYDVDGTTAVSLVYGFLRNITKKIEFYIPDRYDEGYGISYKGIDFARKHGFTLMIALDCGIKAVEKVKYAKEIGLDIIICDHHRPGDEVPDAAAVLDPKQPGCEYPYKELSGCGVGFKLIQALATPCKISMDKVYAELDLVAISIAADIVPITDENRVLAYFGLKKLNTNPRVGVHSLLLSSGVQKNEKDGDNYYEREINISDLVFMVGPRINAAGRIDKATDSVKLLISHVQEYAEKLGGQINELNLTRRDLDSNITNEAIGLLNNDERLQNRRTTVVYRDYWHKGVIGIVASRLIESYYRPTIVLTLSNGLVTGSARSIKNFDIYDAIDSCSHLLEHFGGHMYAAGLALKPENLDQFIQEFEDYAVERLTDEMMVPEIEIDEELYISDINFKFYKIMKQFAPFGPGNMSPFFKTNNVIDTGYAKVVGKNGHDHLKFSVVHPDRTGSPLPAIAFNQRYHYDEMKSGKPFSICYHIDENTWLGQTTLQLRVNDIKFD